MNSTKNLFNEINACLSVCLIVLFKLIKVSGFVSFNQNLNL